MQTHSRVNPINNNLLVKQLPVAREGLIHLPEVETRDSIFCTIIELGSKVKDKGLDKGVVIVTNLSKCQKTKDGLLLVKEFDIIMIMRGKVIFPFGNRILIERNTEEEVVNGIIRIACYESKDQTLEGFVIRKGLKDGKIVDFPVEVGDKIKISKWDISIHEVGNDGKYYLSVPFSLMEFKYES